MSTKPLTLPRWANVGGSIVVPPAGTLNVGHLSNQAPLHSYENWYKNLVYQWIVWLDDGDVAFDAVTATTLTTTGDISAIGANMLCTTVFASTVNGSAVNGSTTLTGGACTFNTATISNSIDCASAIALGSSTTIGTISPTIATGNNNDYNPTNFFACTTIRFQTSGGTPTLTGLQVTGALTNGRVVVMVNTGATNITITHQDAASSANNRFITPTGASITLATHQSVTWMYDSQTARWRLIAKNF